MRRLQQGAALGEASPIDGDDSDLGVIGSRPAVLVKPDETNTGPRAATTQTLSGADALAAVLVAPVEADGKRYLRRTSITSGLRFNAAAHANIVFENCIIDGNWGLYAVRGWYNEGSGVNPAGDYPEFRYCEIKNATSAALIGQNIRFLRCHIHHGADLFKPFGPSEVYACYMHGNWHEEAAHCDVIQIVSGAAGLLLHWNNLAGFNASDSPVAADQPVSGTLQTGSVTGDIGPVQWFDNWLDGGGYTIRGATSDDTAYLVSYEFRRNKFGRGFTYGPLYHMSGPNIVVGTTNVWEDTGQPVTG